jgi:hypothetical protein
VFNKTDIEPPMNASQRISKVRTSRGRRELSHRRGMDAARCSIIEIAKTLEAERSTIVGDIIGHGELVLLVVPSTLARPRAGSSCPSAGDPGHPGQRCRGMVVKEREIEYVLSSLKEPPVWLSATPRWYSRSREICRLREAHYLLIVFSRLKGDLAKFVEGVKAIDTLHDGTGCSSAGLHPPPGAR